MWKDKSWRLKRIKIGGRWQKEVGKNQNNEQDGCDWLIGPKKNKNKTAAKAAELNLQNKKQNAGFQEKPDLCGKETQIDGATLHFFFGQDRNSAKKFSFLALCAF